MPKNRDKWNKSVKARMASDKAALLGHLKKMPILQIAIERTQISRSTYYNWRDEDKQFRKDADAAIAEGEALITDMSESQLIALIRDKHFPAVQFWLRHHHQKFLDKLDITAHIEKKEELTPEQQEVVRRALQHAALIPKDGESRPSEA